ncbi:MAG: M50 family metallopeptidase [Promethearchaeota archaeon]
MPLCYHCGEEVSQTYHCFQCGQDYCYNHQEPMNHDCNIVRESLNIGQMQTSSPSFVSVPRGSPTIQDQINQQQRPPQTFRQQTLGGGYTASGNRGTTDGSFTWYRQESAVPENAFDSDSGIEFKGIMLPHKSEFLHLLIGAALIFIIGLIGFYNEQLISLNLTWAIFMLAGFYTTAFLFHEFGHRQVAKHFGLQTKFRLLTFGMILTVFGLIAGLSSLFIGGASIPSLALPGAVVVLGLDKIDRKTGLCKAAGPVVNLVYGTFLLIVSFIIPTDLYPLNMFIAIAAALNFTLGLFNMIPIGILDGQNIFKWNKQLYIILFSALLLLLIITYANVYAPLEASPYVPEEWKTSI